MVVAHEEQQVLVALHLLEVRPQHAHVLREDHVHVQVDGALDVPQDLRQKELREPGLARVVADVDAETVSLTSADDIGISIRAQVVRLIGSGMVQKVFECVHLAYTVHVVHAP